ncbi:uncharacterized protein LOC122922697 isoform X2 [Bufo gargarizans]|uniref:uncharacterized protein LOC122922685 isoform X2 n=1 Tax=Bufo gargarizans TaxID=30331 RepID=UPI001CF3D586|nr:uncharacterized protein LOC122922685 isoform X2 [Bufo gargarizans]XP_044129326.1 uncharacterized protein LOC122922697 isoform X2 [Bufo gargarizans]
MTATESMIIKQLQQNSSFVIKEADKDPTTTFKKKLDQLLKRAFDMKIITKRELQFLEPYVLGLKSYIRDSMHLIQQLKQITLPADTLLVTCDVESLYSNIAHDHGIMAVEFFLSCATTGDPAHHTFLGSRQECEDFIKQLNDNQLNITLTSNISELKVDFLDLQIKVNDGRLVTSLFRKHTATNNILHFSSFHPKHLKMGIPGGQFLRLRRNCTEMHDFKMASEDLSMRLHERGYPKKVISRAFENAKGSIREDLFIPRPKPRDGKVRLITKYNNQWSDLYKILNTHWFLLQSDTKLAAYVDAKPKIIARRATNLKDTLVYSHFQRPTTSTGRGTTLKGTLYMLFCAPVRRSMWVRQCKN